MDINGPDCVAFMCTVRIWRGSSLQTYLAQYAHTLPSILPDVAHILPNALGQNLFGYLELGEGDLQC